VVTNFVLICVILLLKKSFLILGAVKSKQLQNIEASVKRAATAINLGYKIKSVNVAEVEPPELEEMKQFDAVLIFSDARFFDPELLGNRLADYADAGGGVVFATFANCSNNLQLRGRFCSDFKYLAMTVDTQKNLNPEKPHFMRTLLPEHPVLKGVTSFDAGIYRSKCNLLFKEGVQLISEWDDGVPLVAESFKGKVVTLNFFPVNSIYLLECWKENTDGDRIILNSLMHVSAAREE